MDDSPLWRIMIFLPKINADRCYDNRSFHMLLGKFGTQLYGFPIYTNDVEINLRLNAKSDSFLIHFNLFGIIRFYNQRYKYNYSNCELKKWWYHSMRKIIGVKIMIRY